MELTKPVSRNMSRHREERGLTISGLSQRTGISVPTLMALEAGERAPSVDSLWTIATILDAPFGALLETGLEGVRGVGDEKTNVRLIERKAIVGGGSIELFAVSIAPGVARKSAAHPPGVKERVMVTCGPLLVGDSQSPQLVTTGEVYAFDADVPHVYMAPNGAAEAMVLVQYPADPQLEFRLQSSSEWPEDAEGWDGVRGAFERMCIEVANGFSLKVLRFRACSESSSLIALGKLRHEVLGMPTIPYRWPVLVLTECDELGPFLAVLPQRFCGAFQAGSVAPSKTTLAGRAATLSHIAESVLCPREKIATFDEDAGGSWTLEALASECALQNGVLRMPSQLQRMAARKHHGVTNSSDGEAFSSRIEVDHYDAFELLHPAYARQVVAMAQDIATFVPAGSQASLRTIDVGTGPGVPLLMLQELLPGMSALAVEPDPVAYACLEINTRERSGISLYRGDFLELTQPDGQSGLITSVGSSHHFNTAFMLQKASRLLQSGGVLSVADEFLPLFHDMASRNTALVLHHASYILETAALIERSGYDVPDDGDGTLYREICRHLVAAVVHAQEGDGLKAERLCRRLFSIVKHAGLDKMSRHAIGSYTRFFWLELQAMVAGFDYEVERKTHVRRFLEMAKATGFELLNHRRVFATWGLDERDGGTHVITLRKPFS